MTKRSFPERFQAVGLPPHAAALLCAMLLAALPAVAAPLSVFVSILPQKTIVERVGGDHVRVSVMVGPGQSPATFEPRPRQMAALAGARLYYRIGVPFESVWMERIRAANPRLEVLDARDGIPLRPVDQAPGHGHGHGEAPRDDPHIWLSPERVKTMARRLRDRLIALDPPHAADYRANTAAFVADLDRLQRRIQERLAGVRQRSFMVFHPSWGYFADEFGLRQIPIESGGRAPGAATLTRLTELARREGIRVIFVQPQFSQAQARAVARAVGARLVTVDTLAEDFLSELERMAAAIAGEKE